MIEKAYTILNKYASIIVPVGLFLLIFAVYFPLLSIGFFSDDYHMLSVVSDQGSVWKYWITNLIGERGGHSYGPIYNMVFTLEYWLFGLHSLGYHVFTLFFHFMSACLVFFFGRALSKRVSVGLGAAILFSILPNHTESLAWVSVQPHVLSTLGYLGALLSYFLFLQKQTVLRYIVMLGSVIFALFSKDAALTLPIALILMHVFFSRPSFTKESLYSFFRTILPVVAITGVYLFLRTYTTQSGGYYAGALDVSFFPLLSMFVEITVNMFVVYPARMIVTHFLPTTFVVLLLLPFFLYFFILYTKRIQKSVRTPLWFLCCLYPVVLAPFLLLQYNVLHDGGERYAYLGSSIFFILFSYVIYTFLRRYIKQSSFRLVYFGIFFLFFLLFIPISISKNMNWEAAGDVRDSIFSSELVVSSDDYVLFVGIPDNIDGAELFRNAIFESFSLENDMDLSGERLPLYTLLDKDRALSLVFEEVTPYEFLLTPQENDVDDVVFTGFPHYDHAFGSAELGGFDSFGSVGRSIRIVFDEEKIEDAFTGERSLVLVYFSDGVFQSVSLY
ncbi:MAG: hypothetical protein HN726_02995 [Candidatus Magasanikbacteria bacterium]|jgi:hypothetical protein|nr:hypothetical protein [Candidatus Magasanikbacteria bacterium]MBT4220815.1 hypothetical protein [Candidatus Magasanikbacteria bacterium]MBT4350160.1 hypothetical protein [Candidatus Magasanikbacteria bacterium]MBT4541397.1 hypothetical protein [Candidatus Magasanikbacteria bacterium]MBT6253163.1 hypothetical protein [Candidatus Magasanikbacteria bacterium]